MSASDRAFNTRDASPLSPGFLTAARYIPIGVIISGVITIAACVITVIVDDVYIGDIPWPYLSDTGRDPPAYFIFSIGAVIIGLFIIATMVINWMLTKARLGLLGESHSVLNAVSNGIGAVAAIPLALLAILDTVNYPDPHQYAAYAMFVLLVIFIILDTIMMRKLSRHDPSNVGLRRSYIIKFIIAGFAFVFVVLYLGTAAAVTFERLTIADCLSKNLGTDYCTNEMRLNTTETKLWNYSNEKGMNTLRAVAQHLSVLSILCYISTKSYDASLAKNMTTSSSRVAASKTSDLEMGPM